jgi:hypothetical protein
MQAFQVNYLAKCSELSVEPLPAILSIFKGSGSDPYHLAEILDLSGISLSIKACSALSFALLDSSYFTKIILADAFLGDDGWHQNLTLGCIKLANALKSNTSVLYLDLRGNSIRSDGAIALGQMLKVNNKLEQYAFPANAVSI